MQASFPAHPGNRLRTEMVEPHGMRATSAAEQLRVSRQAMSGLLNGRAALSADMAVRFERAFGVRAEMMLRMQTAHDLVTAQPRVGEVVRVAA